MENVVANTYFEKILPERENIEVLNEALEIQQLGDEVVERLRWLEANDPGIFWWEDKILMELFDDLYCCGCITLPRQSVDRLRWIALICVEISKIYEFDCGNVVLPIDYFPTDKLDIFEGVYPTFVIEAVIKVRKRLEESGWKSLAKR